MLGIMTKMEAINTILSAIGESPIDTLDENDNVDVANALRILDTTSRSIQMQGYDFNTYASLVLQPDTYTKQIRFNKNLLHWKATNGSVYVKRGDFFYDMTNSTDSFSDAITLKAIVAVDFEDLPTAFKDYITAKTARKFQTQYLGDSVLSQDLQIAEAEAYQRIIEYDMNMSTYNMFNLTGVAAALERS